MFIAFKNEKDIKHIKATFKKVNPQEIVKLITNNIIVVLKYKTFPQIQCFNNNCYFYYFFKLEVNLFTIVKKNIKVIPKKKGFNFNYVYLSQIAYYDNNY